MGLRLSEKLLCVIAVLAAVNVAVLVTGYFIYPGYLDHGEPIVAAAAYKMLSGVQVYPSFDSSNFTSNVYGPYLYLANGFMLWVFGGSVASGKLIGLVAVVLAIISTVYAFRNTPRFWALLASVGMIGYILVCLPFSIWNRPDPLLLLVSALGLLIARSEMFERRKMLGWVLVGALGGVACSLKIYGPLFLMPIAIYLAVRDRSFFSLIIMSAAGALTALIPFALPVFSLSNYLAWFGIVGTKPTDGEMVTKALRYGIFFLLPPMFLVAQRIISLNKAGTWELDKIFAYAISTLAGAAGCIYLASKPGAGMYYVLPFAPLIADMIVLVCRENAHVMPKKKHVIPSIVCGLLIAVMFVTSIPIQKRFVRALEWDRTTNIQKDLHAIMSKFEDASIHMGMGDKYQGYNNTLQKTELIFEGNPYVVDFGVMIETSKLGIPLPKLLVDRLSRCEIDMWLIPRGEQPFEMTGYYENTVVDKKFKEAFLKYYQKTDQSEYFDIWQCSRP